MMHQLTITLVGDLLPTLLSLKTTEDLASVGLAVKNGFSGPQKHGPQRHGVRLAGATDALVVAQAAPTKLRMPSTNAIP